MTANEITPKSKYPQINSILKKNDIPDEDTLHSIADNIKQDCSNYLQLFKKSLNRVLYRGQSVSNYSLVYTSHSPSNRPPTTSDQEESRLYDSALEELGIEAQRHNSIFTTSHIELAEFYGTPYVIIPKNTAVYSWSRMSRDLVLNRGSVPRSAKPSGEFKKEIEEVVRGVYGKMRELELKSELPLSRNETRDYWIAIDSLNEYLKYGRRNSWIYVNLRKTLNKILPDSLPIVDKMEKNYENSINVDINAFKEKFDPTDKDLLNAMTYGHEVMIHGEYYAIELEKGWPLFERYLLGDAKQ